jgi:hypothetical protein
MSTVVFTVTSNGYKFMTWNLWLHCQRIGVPWTLLIICLDKESHRFFQTIANIPSVLLPSVKLVLHGDTTIVSSHGSGDFNRITREKLTAFTWMLEKNYTHYLYLDSDIILFRDPVPYLDTILSSENYLWFQCDEHGEGDYTCSGPASKCTNVCTGVIAFYKDESTKSKLLSMVNYDADLWKSCKDNNDQEYIQKKIVRESIQYKTLSRDLYPNGFFLGKDHWKSLNAPHLLHFNFIVGQNKQRVIKSKGFWLVPY